jgi:hypothetical protein
VKLRLPGRRSDAESTPDASDDLTAQLVKAGGKGRPTPKRTEAQGRRTGPPPPPPTTRKEAYKRMRTTQAADRPNARARAARGDENYLPARDRGPVKKLTRDVVDSRRNIGGIFLFVAAIVLASYFTSNVAVKTYLFAAFTGFFILIVIDSFVLARKIKRVLAERLPNERQRGAVWYGISRSTMIRRWRFPKPAVSLGAEL